MHAMRLLSVTEWQTPLRLVGGLGLLLGVIVLLAVPVLLVGRSMSRRRQRAAATARPTVTVDAWSASSARLGDPS